MTFLAVQGTFSAMIGDSLSDKQIDGLTHKLRQAGLRPTRQRVAIAACLFDGRDRHVSAEQLREELTRINQQIALATIYNCLHQFEEAGLLRSVYNAGDAVLYDTNLSSHYHFIDVETGKLMDINPKDLHMPVLPELPEGYEVESLELTIRMRRKG